MLEMLRKRREDEEGFTLIELMVVILIIAILIAIAIPTFLGAQKRAKDRGAQSDLRNALSAAKTIATDYEGAFCVDNNCSLDEDAIDASFADALEDEEGALNFAGAETAPTNSNLIHVNVEQATNDAGTPITHGQILLMRLSKSGKMWALRTNSDGEVFYCQGDDASGAANAVANCSETEW